MQINTGEVVKLLSEGYRDIAFTDDILQHAAERLRSDPQGYQELRQQLADTGNLDAARFDKEVAVVAEQQKTTIPPLSSLAISRSEMDTARLTPKCIVEKYLYADVSTLAAPGGVGKTTLMLFEPIHVILGYNLFGLRVDNPGKVLIVTAEDTREILVARLRGLMEAQYLSDADQDKVLASLHIWDVSGQGRKLVCSTDGNIIITELADQIIEASRDQGLVLVQFDPLVSFGADEGRVNTNENALVEAARRIRNGLDVCVRLIHHTGQAAARDGALDQYTGRG